MGETFVFAPEIEEQLCSICFYNPQRIALVRRELDLEVHIIQAHVRHIIEATELVYGELNATDFPSVIQALREMGKLELCGGAQGVNDVFEKWRYGVPTSDIEEKIFWHYIDTLKRYALNRAEIPPKPVYRFSDGKGTVFPVKVRRSLQTPDFEGVVSIGGKLYAAQLWFSTDGNYINLKFRPT